MNIGQHNWGTGHAVWDACLDFWLWNISKVWQRYQETCDSEVNVPLSTRANVMWLSYPPCSNADQSKQVRNSWHVANYWASLFLMLRWENSNRWVNYTHIHTHTHAHTRSSKTQDWIPQLPFSPYGFTLQQSQSLVFSNYFQEQFKSQEYPNWNDAVEKRYTKQICLS